MGGVCLQVSLHRGGLPTGGICIQGCLHLGGCADPPPELEKWAVRILLECFLVWILFSAIYQGVAVSIWMIQEKLVNDKYASYHHGWSLWAAVAAGCLDIVATIIVILSQPSMEHREPIQY